MPVIVIKGTAVQEMSDCHFEQYAQHIKMLVSGIKKLGLNPGEVSCYASKDRIPKDQSKEIIIFVEGLFKKPGRKKKIREKLAEEIVKATHLCFMSVDLIECFINPFNPKRGFFSFVRKT